MLRESDLTPLPKALDWQCLSPKRGETVVGVLAGRIRNFRCHNVKGKSKPCVTFATDGKLKCWCVDRPVSVRTVAYAPVYGRDGDRFVILLSAVAAYKIRDVEPGTLMQFTRPDRAKCAVVAARVQGPTAMQEWVMRAKKKCDVDILEYLCHLWQIHALTKFCGFDPRRSLNAASVVDISEEPYQKRFVSHVEKLQAEGNSNTEAA